VLNRSFVPFLFVALAGGPAAAQTAPPAGADGPVVVTSGEGLVRRAPDRAWVTIAAESRGATAEEAQRLNIEAMNAVNQRIKAAGVPADAIQTTGYNLQPEFDWANGRQRLRDYAARNQIQVKVDDLPKLGAILAAAVSSGATNVSNVRFDLQDRNGAEREALRRAVADARGRADAAASGAGMRIDHVVRIEEQRAFIMPPPVMPMMARPAGIQTEAMPVPIESGEIEIRTTVTLTAALR